MKTKSEEDTTVSLGETNRMEIEKRYRASVSERRLLLVLIAVLLRSQA
jgi:hypothetical protein